MLSEGRDYTDDELRDVVAIRKTIEILKVAREEIRALGSINIPSTIFTSPEQVGAELDKSVSELLCTMEAYAVQAACFDPELDRIDALNYERDVERGIH